MKQLLQNISSGETSIEEVPSPGPKPGNVLIQTTKSLVSLGTEKMLVDFGNSNLLKKAISQPAKVKEVLQKTKTDGIIPTYEAVRSKLDKPIPMGYCNVGKVINGEETHFDEGMRVVSNGHHAEIVRVPKNLVCSIPDNVDDETASFTVLGAICLQGIRLAKPTLGESFVVIGLGVLGLLSIQILRAHGCRVLGVDIDEKKCAIARSLGIEALNSSEEDLTSKCDLFSRSRGVDGVLITASSSSNEIIKNSAEISKKKGRIVLIGVVGLELNREDFYEKELTFQVSCSYGPGRYDYEYEEKGLDYPFSYVRWTEQRNFEAVLDMMSTGAINVKPLISDRFRLEDANEAYERLQDNSSIGIIFEYQNETNIKDTSLGLRDYKKPENGISISLVGGGNYASRTLLPCFRDKDLNISFNAIITDKGVSAKEVGKKYNFALASTNLNDALDEETDIVVISTRHDSHADIITRALEKNKHIFVEKPLALSHSEVKRIKEAYKKSNSILMVGYNRRFSPLITKMKSLLDKKTHPKYFIMTMNAGYIPQDHWTQDSTVGGGRIIGEACHYIDLMSFLAQSKVKSYKASKMSAKNSKILNDDNSAIVIKFQDGSIGTIHYFSNGNKSYQKERIEVFCEGQSLKLDNFRKLSGYGWKDFNQQKLWKQNKGQKECVAEFLRSVHEGTNSPIRAEEIFDIAELTIDIANNLKV